jgi:hypothetical protein
VALLMLGVVTMAEIEPGHVHAGGDEFPNAIGAVDGRAECANDFRATIHGLKRKPPDCRSPSHSSAVEATERLKFLCW